jgi:CRP-like cAMP-binding protein
MRANRLLASLPREAYLRLAPGLVPVSLAFGEVLHEAGAPIRAVYFPLQSAVSLLTVADGHGTLEVGLVGREGMVGITLALGLRASPVRALVQSGGGALSLSAARLRASLRASPALGRALQRYAGARMSQLARSAACHRFHLVEARLARWLLMTRDSVGAGEIRLTQTFLARMLGVRREGVTGAASALQRRGLIGYRRGGIRIVDHAGLEAAACGCYAPVRQHTDARRERAHTAP